MDEVRCVCSMLPRSIGVRLDSARNKKNHTEHTERQSFQRHTLCRPGAVNQRACLQTPSHGTRTVFQIQVDVWLGPLPTSPGHSIRSESSVATSSPEPTPRATPVAPAMNPPHVQIPLLHQARTHTNTQLAVVDLGPQLVDCRSRQVGSIKQL